MQLTGKDRLVYRRALEAVRETGVTLETAAREYSEARKHLGGVSVVYAAKFYARHHERETVGWRFWLRRYPKTFLAIMVLSFLVPFAAKALHIDDPLFVWSARQMQSRWWDPYGFDVNWYGFPLPMHQITKNPPLACAFIALIISVFGENAFALHVGFICQAVAVVLGTYALARRLCDTPFQAAVAAVFTPVFLVSSTTVMCDTMMVALWVWAVVLWMRALQNNQPLLFVLAALLISACSLSKYVGMALIPLLLVYSLIRNGRPGWWLIYFLIPIVIIGFYEYATRALYGHGLVGDAFTYVGPNAVHGAGARFSKVLTSLGFIGGCCAIVPIFAPVLWRRKVWLGIAITALLLLPTTWVLLGSMSSYKDSPARLGISLLWTLVILGGVGVLALPIVEWKRSKNADTLLVGLWVWGTFAFCVLNWTVNARSVLPMVPAVAILLFRRIDFLGKSANPQLKWLFGAAAVLSLMVCLADYRLANSARAAAAEIRWKFGDSPGPIWFQGHWGFQYYAEANGMRPYDSRNPKTRPGDLLVVPVANTNLSPVSLDTADPIAVIEKPVFPWVTTMSHALGAGFYTDVVGPLPFSFGAVLAEKYIVFRVKGPVKPK